MNRKKAIVLRARLAFLGMVFFAAAIFGRICWIQWVEGAHWQAQLQKQLIKRRVVPPTRGNIYSDNGSLLATSLPQYRVAFDPTKPDGKMLEAGLDSLSWLLSSTLPDAAPERYYRRTILDYRAKGDKFIYLYPRTVRYELKKKMMTWPIFRAGQGKGGVIFEKFEKRNYPFVSLAKRTIGSINSDGPQSGLELSYNKALAGVPGEAIFRKMAGGYWKPIFEITKPTRGLDVQTTLDVNIQDVAQASLERHLMLHEAKFGCVVVMKVETGEIKAMANLKRMSDGTYDDVFNYAVRQASEPGSTFKLASFMALLEEGAVNLEDTLNTGNGRMKFNDKWMTDSHEGGNGKITAQQVFEKSSNIGTSYLVQKHFGKQPSKYLEYLNKFGLSQPMDFQLRGGPAPYIKTLNDPSWSGVTLPWMSVGYETLLTPLQVLTFYNGVANGGNVVQPILVKELRDGDKVKQTFETKVLAENICSEKTLEQLKSLLKGVVERGTAKNIFSEDLSIAGKTGTAQKIINGQYTTKYYTSFCGFFPADAPRYSCIVVIDEPKGWGMMGGDVSAPVFREVARKINSLEAELHQPLAPPEKIDHVDFPVIQAGFHEDLAWLCNHFGLSNYNQGAVQTWAKARPVNHTVQWSPLSIADGKVPDARGMTLRDALFLLENQGYRVTHSGRGRVAWQSLPAGMRAAKGTHISLEMR